MSIIGFLYLYILLVLSVSIVSYKRGIYLIWITLLMFPPILLQYGIKLNLSFITILMICSFFSEMRFAKSRAYYSSFITENQKAIILYLLVSFFILFMSQTVPVGIQLSRLFDELVMMLFALQTYLLVKENEEVPKNLMWIICGIVIFNIIYCVFFEVCLRVNPAGLPLYLLMGVDESEFIVDMAETESERKRNEHCKSKYLFL